MTAIPRPSRPRSSAVADRATHRGHVRALARLSASATTSPPAAAAARPPLRSPSARAARPSLRPRRRRRVALVRPHRSLRGRRGSAMSASSRSPSPASCSSASFLSVRRAAREAIPAVRPATARGPRLAIGGTSIDERHRLDRRGLRRTAALPRATAPTVRRPATRHRLTEGYRRSDLDGVTGSTTRSPLGGAADRTSRVRSSSDGTLLKPVAVDTTVADGSDLMRTYKVKAGDTLTGIATQVRRLDDDALVGEQPQVEGRARTSARSSRSRRSAASSSRSRPRDTLDGARDEVQGRRGRRSSRPTSSTTRTSSSARS